MGVQKPARSARVRGRAARPIPRELSRQARVGKRAAQASQGSGLSPSAHRDQRMAFTRMGLGPISKATHRPAASTKEVLGKGKKKARC